MKKLLEEEKNNKEEDSTSSDSRYKAKITEQQQQHYEELKKLQESYKEKSKKATEKADVNEEAQKNQEKKVDVSKKKSILRIITDAFTLIVQPKKWDTIIEDLRSLFNIDSQEAQLLKDLKTKNKVIASLLHHLKSKDKLFLQLRIAELLREVALQNKVTRGDLIKLSVIQRELISNLRSIANVESQQLGIRRELTTQTQIDRGNIPGAVRDLAKQVIPNVFSELKGATQSSMMAVDEKNRYRIPNVFDAQSAYYKINNQNNQPYHISYLNITKPLESAIDAVKFLINKVITEIKGWANQLDQKANVFNNCNNYRQQNNTREVSCTFKSEERTVICVTSSHSMLGNDIGIFARNPGDPSTFLTDARATQATKGTGCQPERT